MKNSVEVKKLSFNYGKLEILKNLDLNIHLVIVQLINKNVNK